MRVHEIAKKTDKTSKEVIAACKKLGIEAKAHMSVLSDADAKKVTKELSGAKKAKAAPKKPKTEKAVPTGRQAAKPKAAKKKTATKKAAPKKKAMPAGRQEDAAPKAKKTETKKISKKDASELIKQRIAEKLHRKTPITPKPFQRKGQQQKSTQKKKPSETLALSQQYVQRHAPGEKPTEKPKLKAGKDKISINLPITVGALATNMELKTSELIKALMEEGIFANVNQLLNEEIVKKVTAKLEVTLDILPTQEEELLFKHEEDDDDSKMKLRPPVVTLMGHVDHGKTSLLDAIRDSRIVDREAGKITQHMGAYSVPIEGKGDVTFLDTPGHEAFTAMRSRGANITDVVVLVVAADDGVMPQTVEAINHARAANVPIVVAINKSDLATAQPDKVKAELQKHDLTAEDWGGKTIMANVSAVKKTGIKELLELLLLEAEILELKANPEKPAQGIVLEAKISKNHGTVTHALVTAGTLKIGDYVICGSYFGKVRAMHDDLGRNIKKAGPSMPVEILGVQGVPNAADSFYVVSDEKTAKKIAEQKTMVQREKDLNAKLVKHTTLESIFEKAKEGLLKDLKIVIKADVQGSLEVLQQSLEKLSTDKIKLKVIHAAVGGINESDVMLATASDAIVIGFHVKASLKTQELIEREGIDVRYYKIIYEAIEDVKVAMEGKLEPTLKEITTANLEVRNVFKASKIGLIAGCYVLKGKITRNDEIRVLRDDIVIFEGKIKGLKRFKDDAREVKENLECGVTIANFNDVKVGDRLETFTHEKIAAKL